MTNIISTQNIDKQQNKEMRAQISSTSSLEVRMNYEKLARDAYLRTFHSNNNQFTAAKTTNNKEIKTK